MGTVKPRTVKAQRVLLGRRRLEGGGVGAGDHSPGRALTLGDMALPLSHLAPVQAPGGGSRGECASSVTGCMRPRGARTSNRKRVLCTGAATCPCQKPSTHQGTCRLASKQPFCHDLSPRPPAWPCSWPGPGRGCLPPLDPRLVLSAGDRAHLG